MRPRAFVAVPLALLGSLLVVGVPAVAQDTNPSVTYSGVGFSFDPSLGTSVNITDVPAAPGNPFSYPQPAHLTFTLYGPKPEFGHVPVVADGTVVVEFYRVADMASAPDYASQLANLQDLLSKRPDLKPYTVAHRTHVDQPLPHVPLPGDSAQVIRALAAYVDTPQVSGISYVDSYGQDVAGFSSSSFEHTFQGLSADGTWLVSVTTPLAASMFPKDPPSVSFPTSSDEVTYLNRTSRTLNAAAEDDFSPLLTLIDQLISSITFDAAMPSPQPSESALPSPIESVAPSATETFAATPSGSVSP
jgi:hypothetical protein